MMAENPNWWSMNSMCLNSLATTTDHHHQEFPHSWSQLLMGGLASEEDHKLGPSHPFQSKKKLENWEDQILINPSLRVDPVFDVKQLEVAQSGQGLYSQRDEDFQISTGGPCNWSHQVLPLSSSSPPSSSVTSSNMLNFSHSKGDCGRNHSSHECNSTAAVGVPKKARVQSSSTQQPLKVRKEKLGDRITALHQLVSPFGKTDTASVLFEAISHIGCLQSQIEALSSPYLGNAPSNMRHQQSGTQDGPKDLRSRGLCLVPISCTCDHVGSDHGTDYWAPAVRGGF
ncbi:Transcription factor bHLH68 like [Actinidia chinensis var. chinensis]|uniref:Transcription factor bHLH68 like n=1 Tax=Actinidia chinensis var. chinensis TaxID=1590841 RepID=A0A2R6QZW4_ACTCC|nr:Transcription factor bHLH68 like [Actinidia chinensis var. chinensis]